MFRGDFWAGGRCQVNDLELEVKVVVRLVWGCLNRRVYLLWSLR